MVSYILLFPGGTETLNFRVHLNIVTPVLAVSHLHVVETEAVFSPVGLTR
jgi:hypothetical protein